MMEKVMFPSNHGVRPEVTFRLVMQPWRYLTLHCVGTKHNPSTRRVHFVYWTAIDAVNLCDCSGTSLGRSLLAENEVHLMNLDWDVPLLTANPNVDSETICDTKGTWSCFDVWYFRTSTFVRSLTCLSKDSKLSAFCCRLWHSFVEFLR